MNVFITGAAGGIGYSIVSHMSKRGVKIFAADITEREFPHGVTFFKMDITKEREIIEVCEKLKKADVRLDAIINVAGIFAIDSFIEADSESLRKIFEINYLGCVFVNKTFHPILKNDGRIIITTSEVAPLDPMPYNSIYGVSKSALDAYAQGLRQELQLLGQTVITVRPGAFDTSLSQGSLDKTAVLADKTRLYKKQSARFYKLVKFFIGKPLHPDRLAGVYYKALTKKHPRLIYSKHRNPLLLLMNAMPKRLQCFIIRVILGK